LYSIKDAEFKEPLGGLLLPVYHERTHGDLDLVVSA